MAPGDNREEHDDGEEQAGGAQRQSSASDEITQRRQVFTEVAKAYAYLTNPLTKVIYDEFGVPGLAVYEKNKVVFKEL